jgi:hypothetical protein
LWLICNTFFPNIIRRIRLTFGVKNRLILNRKKGIKMKNKTSYFLLLICFTVFVLSSCNQEDNTVSLNSGNAGTGNTNIGSGNTSFSTITVNSQGATSNPFRIDSGKFLIEFVKIKSISGVEHMFREAQLVMHLGFGRTPTQVTISNVPPGTYNWLQFKLHKHTPNEIVVDPDFGSLHEVGFSGVIKGVYNHVPFVFKTSITDVEHLAIDPPITMLPNNSAYNFTMSVDSPSWFNRNGETMDPSNPQNQHEIDQNIRDSFKRAYRDNNRDGLPDNFDPGNTAQY